MEMDLREMTSTQNILDRVVDLVREWQSRGRSGFSMPVLRGDLLNDLEGLALGALPSQTSVQDLVQQLDAKYPGWDMYRSATKQWIFQLRRSNAPNIVLESETIEGVLQTAFDFRDLPIVPPRPRTMCMSVSTFRKDGSKWIWYYDGKHYQGNFPSRKAAVELAEKIIANQNQCVDKWLETYGPIVARGTEGIDYISGYA